MTDGITPENRNALTDAFCELAEAIEKPADYYR